ncbi:hypothetical protein SEA_MRYOLO_87 [Mycobacterium phage Mryolo]|nr:hypothetical protein SEA_MRYOLO_87 [Mycobacterium phage Mryolo]
MPQLPTAPPACAMPLCARCDRPSVPRMRRARWLTRLRMRCGSGSTGLRIEGMPGFGIEPTFRDRSSRSTSIGSMDRGRVRRMLRAFGGRPARRMAAGISLRWGQPRCSRSISWFEGAIGPLPRRDWSTGAVYREAGGRRSAGL